MLIDLMRTKDIQIYFNPGTAEKLLQFYHFDDSIQSTAGDGIFVVDANIAPSCTGSKKLDTTIRELSQSIAGWPLCCVSH